MPTPDLQRFLDAQAPIYEQARTELLAGEKRSHWMWFIFPQVRGLGFSPTSIRYGIADLPEASAYLAHPVLGPRLRDCTSIVAGLAGRSLRAIFGSPDDLKFHSSVTLFAAADPADPVFRDALTQLFGGKRDGATLNLLKS